MKKRSVDPWQANFRPIVLILFCKTKQYCVRVPHGYIMKKTTLNDNITVTLSHYLINHPFRKHNHNSFFTFYVVVMNLKRTAREIVIRTQRGWQKSFICLRKKIVGKLSGVYHMFILCRLKRSTFITRVSNSNDMLHIVIEN